MKQLTFTIKGIAPLLTHNERLANPFDDTTRAIKAISGKRKKTEDDLLEIAQLEWRGGLYYDEETGPYVPGYNMLAALISAGKVHKLGTAIKRAAVVLEDRLPIEYQGPRDPDALFADKRFVDIRNVKVSGSRIVRARPRFHDWKLRFTLAFDESTLQAADVAMVLQTCGSMIGLGDYRPRFGRFEVLA